MNRVFFLFLGICVIATAGDEPSPRSREEAVRERFEALAQEYGLEIEKSPEGLKVVDPVLRARRLEANKNWVKERLENPELDYHPSKRFKDKVAELRTFPKYVTRRDRGATLTSLIIQVVTDPDFIWTSGTKGLLFRVFEEAATVERGSGAAVIFFKLSQKEITPGVVETLLRVVGNPNSSPKIRETILDHINPPSNSKLFSIPLDPDSNQETLQPILDIARSNRDEADAAKEALKRTGLLAN